MIILVGASASGKTEVAKRLGRKFHIRKVVTHTTRAMRQNEVNDVDYHFVDADTFIELKNNDAFVETTIYNGNYYGTSKKEISDDSVLIVDPNGLKAFQALRNPRIVTFYMYASEQTRLARMRERGDSEEKAQSRIHDDRVCFNLEYISKPDYAIDCEVASIDEVTLQVYQLYKAHLNSLS